MERRMKQYLLFAILVFILSSCGIGYNEISSINSCEKRVDDSTANIALSYISFSVPSGWTEIVPKQKYASAASLLNVFIFDASGTSTINCVETLIEVVSFQSVVDDYKINSSEFSIDDIPAVMAVADGYSDTSRDTPFRGIYAGFEINNWIYVFTWDAFGLDAVGEIKDEAISTINSIRIMR